jgi:glycosyltransferase involved in cell wall biosynthesis
MFSGLPRDNGVIETMDEKRQGTFHVLHVLTRLPVGGVENMLLKVVQGYDPERFRVSICCIKEGGEIADELKRLGYPVFVLGRMQGKGFDWLAMKDLYRLMKQEKIDILRTHQYHANFYGRIAGIFAGVPVIVPSFHNRYCSPEMPKAHRRFFNCLLGFFSSRIVAVSDAVAADVIRYDRVNLKKVRVIHNGVDRERFNIGVSQEEARKRFGLTPACFLIGNAGRLSEQKGQRYLIEAAAGIDVSIAIAGDGPLRSELESLAAEHHVRCNFLGMLRPEDVPLFMKSLDLFCFPSLWEGLPSALAEAITAGLPVIASDIPSNREVLGDAGVLVAAKDVVKLHGALQEAVKSRELLPVLREKARKQSAQFSIEHTVTAYEELFIQALKAQGLA